MIFGRALSVLLQRARNIILSSEFLPFQYILEFENSGRIVLQK